jgi:hypothetical protein
LLAGVSGFVGISADEPIVAIETAAIGWWVINLFSLDTDQVGEKHRLKLAIFDRRPDVCLRGSGFAGDCGKAGNRLDLRFLETINEGLLECSTDRLLTGHVND